MAPFTWGEMKPEYKGRMKKRLKDWDEYKEGHVNPRLSSIEQGKEKLFKQLMRAEIYAHETSEGRKATKLEENEIIDQVADKICYTPHDATVRRKAHLAKRARELYDVKHAPNIRLK